MAEQAATFKCDLCGAEFEDADALTKHMAVHGTGGESKAEDKEPLEQGAESPTVAPTMPGSGTVMPNA